MLRVIHDLILNHIYQTIEYIEYMVYLSCVSQYTKEAAGSSVVLLAFKDKSKQEHYGQTLALLPSLGQVIESVCVWFLMWKYVE